MRTPTILVVDDEPLIRFALNDRFQMVFSYALTDGRSGLAIASFDGETAPAVGTTFRRSSFGAAVGTGIGAIFGRSSVVGNRQSGLLPVDRFDGQRRPTGDDRLPPHHRSGSPTAASS